jgi:MSHA biogenesis protein MshQ
MIWPGKNVDPMSLSVRAWSIIALFLLLLHPSGVAAETCFTDDFNRTTLGTADWIVDNSSGTFGDPAISGNRLRLTDTSGSVATMATLRLAFPGAGNKITVIFDHFAYNGSGADGIGVVFSDYATTPVPGAYGGSLGYAQRTGVNGFAGGWIGVGIDEYGNFSCATEGRVGGSLLCPVPPGNPVIDSVSVRGSGSGAAGYAYHGGTGTLNPQVDNNNTLQYDRYRIIIDHSDNIHAWVSVERDATSGAGTAYTSLVAPYDAKVKAGQAAVPAAWWLSFTGSTGGSTNTHEIDNLSICASSMVAPGGSMRIIRWREVVQ